MNLYYLTNDYEKSWDCYDDMVVAADNEDEAKLISLNEAFTFDRHKKCKAVPCNSKHCSYCISRKCLPYKEKGLEIPEEYSLIDFKWVCEEALTVKFIGIAAETVEKGLIIASNRGS